MARSWMQWSSLTFPSRSTLLAMIWRCRMPLSLSSWSIAKYWLFRRFVDFALSRWAILERSTASKALTKSSASLTQSSNVHPADCASLGETSIRMAVFFKGRWAFSFPRNLSWVASISFHMVVGSRSFGILFSLTSWDFHLLTEYRPMFPPCDIALALAIISGA